LERGHAEFAVNAPVPADLTLLVLTDAGQAPEWIRLLPTGDVRSTRGDFVVDPAAIDAILAAHVARGIDTVIDYEHQTLGGEFQSPDGTAPAAGWIREFSVREDGLWGRAEWTPRGAALVANREYRYHSPVPLVDKKTRRAIALHSIALTNDPAILGMTPIVNKAGINEEDGMNGLKELLGLPADANEETILAAVKDLQSFRTDTVAALELQDGTGAAVQAGVLALKNRLATAPTAEAFAELKTRLDRREADDLVGRAVKDGKLSPTMVEAATRLALTDRGAFAAFLEKAPKVVPVGQVVEPGPTAKGSDGLDDAERVVCKSLGLTAETFKKHKQEG